MLKGRLQIFFSGFEREGGGHKNTYHIKVFGCIVKQGSGLMMCDCCTQRLSPWGSAPCSVPPEKAFIHQMGKKSEMGFTFLFLLHNRNARRVLVGAGIR